MKGNIETKEQAWMNAYDLALKLTGRTGLDTAVLTVGIVWEGTFDAILKKLLVGDLLEWKAKQ
jgi:hypothetical protein